MQRIIATNEECELLAHFRLLDTHQRLLLLSSLAAMSCECHLASGLDQMPHNVVPFGLRTVI